MVELNNIGFRPLRPYEQSFVVASMVKSYRASQAAESIPQHVFSALHSRVAALLAQRALCIVATPDDTTLLGFAIAAGSVFHYVYVKPDFRQYGLGARLMREVDGDKARVYSHRTPLGEHMVKHLAPQAQFYPYSVVLYGEE
jgi:GNAT superfamily N-acetyltransferase